MPIFPGGLKQTTDLGVGCAYLTAGSLTRYDERIIHTALDEGALHFDVAPQYGLGTAEAVLGKALRTVRESVTIATKVGIARPSVHPAKIVLRSAAGPIRGLLRGKARPVSAPQRLQNFCPDYVQASIEESLRHLQTDRVDSLLLHMSSPSDISHELVRRLESIRRSGKALAIGLATSRVHSDTILASWPGVFDMTQYSWSVLDPPLKHGLDPFRITHRALARALSPIQDWFERDRAAYCRLSAATNADLANPTVLSRALIGAALTANIGGITLVASRSIRRTKQNVRDGLDPTTRSLGSRFMSALESEQKLPLLRDM